MMLLPSDIPVVWWWGLSIAWTVASLFYLFRHRWLFSPEKSEGFPFSFKQFFFMAFFGTVAASIYVGSFFVSETLVAVLGQTPVRTIVGGYTHSESLVIVQTIALSLSSVLLFLVLNHLPEEITPFVKGSGCLRPLCRGVALGFLLAPTILLCAWITGLCTSFFSGEPKAPQLAIDLFLNLPRTGVLFWVLFFVAVTLVPFVEEALFRGFFQGFLSGLVHPVLTVVLTSVVFASFHYSSLQKGSNTEILAGLFLFSLFASNLRIEANSLWASIGMHAAFNVISLILFMGLS